MKPVYLACLTLLLISCFGNNEIDLPTRTIEEQFAIDTALIDEYLVLNEIEAEIHESGIRYVVEEDGTGISPTVSDSVTVKYEGWLLTGNRFDINQEGVTFPLGALIPAWQIMVPLMKEGGKMMIYTPSVYGYASASVGAIPPNSPLIFDVELIEVLE